MHESSYNEMKAFVERYLDRDEELKVLDMGSLDVNGTYKPLFDCPKWSYTGLDLVDGRNVDIVSRFPYSYPFVDGVFDVVVSGSVLEHVEDIFAFIREAKRVMKPDGIMCIIAPWSYPEHDYPVDCWRILPAGMKYLLETVAGLKVLAARKNETDCVGIAGQTRRNMKVGFGCLVNDPMRLDMVLKQSEIDPVKYPCHIINMPETAVKGLNRLLGILEQEGHDVAVLTHQDMYYRAGWVEQLKDRLRELPESWVVAGIIGKDMDGAICGRVHDMRIPVHFSTSHKLPHPAACFDECCIIVNLKKGFRFNEGLQGFDLYGTLAVLQSWEMGGTAWVIDCFAEHYCMRSFDWFPGKDFEHAFKWLHENYPAAIAPRIDTTVLGVPREANPPRYDLQ
jgi:SAM-dependent methyltransferase